MELRSPLVAGIAGLVVGAVVVGVPWLTSSSPRAFGAEKESLSAPASIGAYTPMAKNPKISAASAKQIDTDSPISARTLSAAYGGAATAVQEYADSGLENFVTLEAVRAQDPTPYLPYVDPRDLGMAKLSQEIDTFGQVTCLVANLPVATGQQEAPDGSSAITCERTSAHLTVRLRFGGGGDLAHAPATAAALVNTAWDSLT